MTSLSNYIDSLVSDLQLLGLHATISSLQYESHSLPADSAANDAQSIQLRIPVTVTLNDAETVVSFASQLRQWTLEGLKSIMPMEMMPGHVLRRLHRAIDQGSRQVQRLLSGEEPAVHRVLLDFVHSVVAEIWEECKQLISSDITTQLNPKEDGMATFDRATEKLLEKLKARHNMMGQSSHDSIITEVARSTTVTEHGVAHVRLVLTA
ncbi:MAG: hypothetical protein U0176_23605 [Bacteroidia bacterium]